MTSLGMDCIGTMLSIYIVAICEQKQHGFAPKRNGLQPNFGMIRSMLYQVSAA